MHGINVLADPADQDDAIGSPQLSDQFRSAVRVLVGSRSPVTTPKTTASSAQLPHVHTAVTVPEAPGHVHHPNAVRPTDALAEEHEHERHPPQMNPSYRQRG